MGCNCTKEVIWVDGNKFHIINRIAEGGFGSIDLVEESRTSRSYALKRVKCDNKNDLEHLSLENKYYKQLSNSPHLVKLVHDDIIEDKKTSGYFIISIFTYYQNGNLQSELESNIKSSNKLIKTERLVKLFQGISSGLQFIHQSKLAHRDLKPQNVLISDDRQQAVLADFGSMTDSVIEITSARKAQEIQDWSAQNCSMFYRAPELFQPKVGQSINETADVWSLGCILYALMFNRGPFDYVAEKGDSIALAVTNVKFNFPTDVLDSRPETLVSLIKNVIVFEPAERQTLSRVLHDLNSIPSYELSDVDFV